VERPKIEIGFHNSKESPFFSYEVANLKDRIKDGRSFSRKHPPEMDDLSEESDDDEDSDNEGETLYKRRKSCCCSQCGSVKQLKSAIVY